VLDLLLACSISLAIAVLIVTLSSTEPLELSTFPSLLLFTTLFRLSLNVASTRLILLQGDAGKIIQTFGGFVAGGSFVVGMVIFLILVIIQFIVITKGAERISEVSARFTLDAMPGKQMAIDADLNAGVITESQANERRAKIVKESEFYGAMDGASKFIRGDAKAGPQTGNHLSGDGPHGQNGGRVRPKSEERGVTQRNLPGVSHQQVQRDREHRVDADVDQHRQFFIRREPRHERIDDQEDHERRGCRRIEPPNRLPAHIPAVRAGGDAHF